MEPHRLPRFRRDIQGAAPLHLTPRDEEIIRLVHQHRFLRSSHLQTLLPGSAQQLLRRLQLLYHHGYLERPRAQIDYYHRGGSRKIIYGVGNKGAKLLRKQGRLHGTWRWGEKNRSVGRLFLEHAVLVSDIMVALELSCRRAGHLRLLTEEQLSVGQNCRAIQWKVSVHGALKLGVVPDRVFALESTDETVQNYRALFFLEADRGTMPVTRKTLTQSSFQRKLLAYAATWSQGLPRTRFGYERCRVLTVTSSPKRMEALLKACGQLERGQGLFLFTDAATLRAEPDLFALSWRSGAGGDSVRLLD